MSDPIDPWKALHAKRSKKSTRNKKTDPFSEWSKPSVVAPAAPRRPEKPKTPQFQTQSRTELRSPREFPRSPVAPQESPTLDFSDPVGSSPSPQPRARSKSKERFLISIDMVTDENRELVRKAARSEGRTLSQWARRVLLAESSGR